MKHELGFFPSISKRKLEFGIAKKGTNEDVVIRKWLTTSTLGTMYFFSPI